MLTRSKLTPMIALASAAALTTTGCGASTESPGAGQSESPATDGSSEALTVYNAQHDTLTQA